MSRSNNRKPNPGTYSASTILMLIGVGLAMLVLAWANVVARLGHKLSGSSVEVSNDIFQPVFGLITKEIPWPASGGWLTAAFIAALVAIGVGFGLVARRFNRRSSRVDHTTSYLGVGRDITPITLRSVKETAARLGVEGPPGVSIGYHARTGERLFGSWEDMHIDIWGTRRGKTTARAIPAIVEAPGAVLVTSNKRDIVDASRGPRSKNGPVWVFDPQGIVGEEPTWWWNPLSYVKDEVRAAKLAEHFASGSREAGARTDAYFEPAGQDLLAGMLLAAAKDNRPITDVYTWLTRPTDETPIRILQDHGYSLLADQVSGIVFAPDKQRAGVYGTAQQMASCLTIQQTARWVTPLTAADARPQFDADQFVREGGTLYSLSKEGRGTAGPLVTALTVAVVEAAEDLATQSPGGRLKTPLVGVLDEAANVCRWAELPNLYSHYGSRGIILMTILQSWSQGVGVWGADGMKKLWSAANVKVYGGGVAEKDFLEDLSVLIGDYDRLAVSTSYHRGARSTSQQLQRDRILDVSDLSALPKFRAVVLASGARPALVRTRPWMDTEHAPEIKQSVAQYDPETK